ncbi:hypothetical protein [Effusibacillus lacus]|uniref:Uncharacterized protein n=1 Tax=Effusibacillus lacus TaxID=1348429 RepID=A0A292YNZ8_9BACL|nr:hypothetical protein [Effusibacillus lacus]TCS76483.1 hypothetical protein EDD64_10227 [Effusibacillus lacus]GAX90493.1 hypothetical protein EFBL_2120 [Effusibacillus lacus]
MTAGKQTARLQGVQPTEWKLVLGTGAVMGIVAGLLSLPGKEWFNWTVPGGMMVASWIVVNRAKRSRFRAGFISSSLAGILAWGLYMGITYSNFVATVGSFTAALQYSAAFLLPLVLIIGLFGTWMFSRTRERVLAAQERVRTERTVRGSNFKSHTKPGKKK